jgi:predicted PurR-regulated permease PerM
MHMEISTRTIIRILFVTAIFVGLLKLAMLAAHPLIWIGTAFFLAIALNPAVVRVSKYMPKKSRGLAATVVFISMVLVVGFLLVSFIPPLVDQTEDLVQNLPGYSDSIINGQGFVSDQVRKFHLVDRVRESESQIGSYLSSAGGSFLGLIKSVFSSLAAGVTIFVLTIFMILEGPSWVATAWRLVPAKKQKNYRVLVEDMYEAVSGYVTGNLLTSLIAAILVSLMLTIVDVPYAIPLGILVGLIDLLPLVGATIAAIIVVLVATFAGSATAGVIMLIFFLIYQQIENHIMQPLIYGKTVKISPLTVLVAILLGATIGGILGALVAIPIAASIQILVKDYANRRLVDR